MAPRNVEDWQVLYPEIKMRSAHLLRSHEWADCTFKFLAGSAGAGGSNYSLDAHKLILAMASPVFAAMFYGGFEKKEDPVLISDIDLPTFSCLLEYIYTDEVIISDTNQAASLYGAANKYILVHLEKRCLDLLSQKLNSDNVCQIYEFSCLYSVEELQQKCLELITTKTQDVLKGPSFKNIHVKTLKQIVSMESLNIASEMDLFSAVVDYADSKVNDNKNHTDDASEYDKSLVHAKQHHENPSGSLSTGCVARKNIPGVIEQIRFLTMTPAELAENRQVAAVLTKDEMFGLLANSVSSNVSIPMPDGFSTSREKRNLKFCGNTTDNQLNPPAINEHNKHIDKCNLRSEATEQWVVAGFKGTEDSRFSPPFFVRGLRWRIEMLPSQDAGECKMLSIYLHCLGPQTPYHLKMYSCYAKVTLRLLSHYPNRESTESTLQKKYTSTNAWGFKKFLQWKEVRNPRNGFIKDDTITIEVYIVAEPPVY
ncbi:BTB/POZ domain-containing protein [Phthorimaea operculella]|nr:BTB/POZ domain-containing protein [Phthorimaea operculella]